MGTEKSKGTKVFALGGKINNTGLVEVPMGTTLREIIYEIGGGIPGDKEFKAAQTGGPSGGCIPASHLDTPIDYDSLTAIGSMMAAAVLSSWTRTTAWLDVARFFLDFTVDESCGKCPPCRIGTKRMLEILERIVNGQGQEGDIEKLESWATTLKCGTLRPRQNSAQPGAVHHSSISATSTRRTFATRSAQLATAKRCSTTSSTKRNVSAAARAKVCPVNAISGKIKNPSRSIRASASSAAPAWPAASSMRSKK